MRVYPKEVTHAIGVHEGHDSIFVSLEATLFNFKSLPIQKVSTSFSDGHWQEEMQFILDTESRWMEGRVGLQLKQKMFVASDDPIIATASISHHLFSNWLHEGGEHSVEIQMDRTSLALEDELTRTMLFLSVKVAAEKVSHQIMDAKTSLTSVVHMQVDEKWSKEIEPHIQNHVEFALEVPTLPGISHDSALVSVNCTVPCSNFCLHSISGAKSQPILSHEAESLNVRVLANRSSLSTRQKRNAAKEAACTHTATYSVSNATSSDDEQTRTTVISNTIPQIGAHRLQLVPTSNVSRSGKKIKATAVHLSMAPQQIITLQPTLDGSTKGDEIKDMDSLDFNVVANHATVRTNLVFQSIGELHGEITSGTSNSVLDVPEDSNMQAKVSSNFETGADPNLLASIKGVSFANHKLLAIIRKNRHSKPNVTSELVIASQNSDSSGLGIEPLHIISGKPDHASEDPVDGVKLDASKGCWSHVGSSLALCFGAVHMMMARFSGRFRRTKRLATVQPISDALDVESEMETLKLSEKRRHQIENSKLQAKKLLEELDNVDKGSEIGPAQVTQDVYDAVEAKLFVAMSQLKDAFFNLPKRAVKVSHVSSIQEFMKNIPTGNSSPFQRLTGIQHFLQSKWIDCDSMLQIMTWIKSPQEEVKFFECMAMRVIDKQGLMMIARRFVFAHGTKFVALKTVERLLVLSNKDTHAREKRRASHFRHENFDGEHDLSD